MFIHISNLFKLATTSNPIYTSPAVLHCYSPFVKLYSLWSSIYLWGKTHCRSAKVLFNESISLMLFQKLSENVRVAAQETQKKQMNPASVKHENSFLVIPQAVCKLGNEG